MKKQLIAVCAALALTACSAPYYQAKSWANKSFDQASSECSTEIQQRGGPPSYDDCMSAKGWANVEECRAGTRCVRRD